MIKAGIIGATGYAGFELVKILSRHPEVELIFLASSSYAGQRYCDVHPCTYEMVLVDPDEAPLADADVVFLCTPHGASAPIAQRVLEAGAKCIDLSADFRLRDLVVYEKHYNAHGAPHLLGGAVYGLTEFYRQALTRTRLVAVPGCYPTCMLLPLVPLAKAGWMRSTRVIVDAKSGVSGAGAKPTPETHFCTVHDNLSAYRVGHTHRHVPEMEQELAVAGMSQPRVIFTPHLLPVTRGILSTIYVELDPARTLDDVIGLWRQAFADEPFVQVLDAGRLATLAHVVNTNLCALSAAPAGAPGEFILVSTLDNLVKGASGQAVQDMNVVFGLDETLGLVG
ncbi:MAG: N-acetyl-gamma-glutamyl-phosphate reductase [Chloroflexi bacterium]|nr:N-acetyl-gamma-glutamyl-phosphate reductase [Chloroflexota bacterium]